VPTLVVNGDRDPFGVPTGGPRVQVQVLPGERHGLGRDTATVARTVITWLRRRHLAH
jgi:hypothetical protein